MTEHYSERSADLIVERASMEATFSSVKRTLAVGGFTAVVVVGGLLFTGGTSLAVTAAVVVSMVVSRCTVAWMAFSGLKAESVLEQRLWTRRLEFAFIPVGALTGIAPSLLPQVEGQVSPQWYGLMVCAVVVVAANVLVGYGRSQTFLAVAAPVAVCSAVSAALVGGELAVFFVPGTFVVGLILVLDNREAGAIFRDARRLEEENRALVGELRGANSVLHHEAHTDALTGLRNRAGLRLHLAWLADTYQTVEVVYLDLDGFKEVNDEFGHAVGDAALVEVGERLARIIRSGDCAARLGGDEFAVITALESEPSASVAERIRESCAEPITVGGVVLDLGLSIGTSRAEPGDDLQRAVRLADAAMYEQKRRNRLSGARGTLEK